MPRKPPMFSGPTISDTPQQYLHRARMFMLAAMDLVDYRNGEQNWPKYALLTHALELALKAFAKFSVSTGMPPRKEPKQHDLSGWYQLAVQYGLPYDAIVAERIEILNELHANHYSRYPQSRSTPIPDASVIAGSTVEHLISIFTTSINPR